MLQNIRLMRLTLSCKIFCSIFFYIVIQLSEPVNKIHYKICYQDSVTRCLLSDVYYQMLISDVQLVLLLKNRRIL